MEISGQFPALFYGDRYLKPKTIFFLPSSSGLCGWTSPDHKHGVKHQVSTLPIHDLQKCALPPLFHVIGSTQSDGGSEQELPISVRGGDKSHHMLHLEIVDEAVYHKKPSTEHGAVTDITFLKLSRLILASGLVTLVGRRFETHKRVKLFGFTEKLS